MPTYSRQFGANLPGFTAIRLVETDIIMRMWDSPFVSSDLIAIELPAMPGGAELDFVHNFLQIDAVGEFSCTPELTEAGTVYNYSISFSYARHRSEMLKFVSLIPSKKFVAVILDSNLKTFIIGQKTQPVLFEITIDQGDGKYVIEGKCQSTILPIFLGAFDLGTIFGLYI